MQKYICEANTECNKDIGGNSIFCQLGRWEQLSIFNQFNPTTDKKKTIGSMSLSIKKLFTF